MRYALPLACLLVLLGLLMAAGPSDSAATAPAPPASQPATRTAAEIWLHYFPRDPEGFTVFPAGQGAQVVFVSSSQGDDSSDGFARPVRTLKRAEALLHNGSADRCLFKRGDVFTHDDLNTVIQRHGRSAMEPMVFGAYGDPKLPRPVFTAMLSLGGRDSQPSNLVLQDLDFYADTRDPDSPTYGRKDDGQGYGIYQNWEGEYLWIEDCRVRFFYQGMCLQTHKAPFKNLIVRRCVVADCYGVGAGHPQGIYLENFENVIFEEDLFDHNGWNEKIDGAVKTVFNHNMYLQHGSLTPSAHIIVRDNISARASSHGCQLRPGGLMEDNLFLKDPLAAFVSYDDSIVRDNVVLDGDGIDAQNPRGQGIELLNCPTVLAEGNVIAHKKDATNTQSAINVNPITGTDPQPASSAEVRHNIVYDWSGPALAVQSPGQGLKVHDNIFAPGDGAAHIIEIKQTSPGQEFRRNRYLGGKAHPFHVQDRDLSPAEWAALSGDDSTAGAVQFVDPDRDIASYARTIQLDPPTLETFLKACREQTRGHWDPRLTADSVNRYIREGFEIKR